MFLIICFYIDDLKLVSESEQVQKALCEETGKKFEAVGLERNRSKSPTNCEQCDDIAITLNASQGYKCLGITENRRSEIAEETSEKIRAEIMKRVRILPKTRLNGRDIIKAMNEYTPSVINY